MRWSPRSWFRPRSNPDPYRLECHDTALGQFYLPALKSDIISARMRKGEIFEERIVRLAQTKIRASSAVLDVGANFGQMTVLFSRMVGGAGRVYSFEADPFVYDVLCRNIAANHCANVRPVPGAVYDVAGTQVSFPVPDLTEYGTFGSYGLVPGAPGERMVSTVTIDSLDIVEPVSFMKVDVQGSDLAAMRGARETIRRHRMPIVFEFEEQFQTRFGTTFEDYSSFIDSIDYRIVDVIYQINFLIVPR